MEDYPIYDSKLHSDGRQNVSAIGDNTLTADRVFSAIGNGTLTADRMLATIG